MYYPYSENKGTDQLSSYYAADLLLCFCICIKPVFHNDALLVAENAGLNLTRDRFSHDYAHLDKIVS